MITTFDNYNTESNFQTAKNWLIDKIQNQKGLVRMSRIREKLINHFELLETFSEENQNITRKELTVITNAFSKVFGQFYGADLNGIKGKEAKEKLYKDLGVYSWEYKGALNMIHLYGLIDAQRNIDKINKFKLTNFEKDFISKYLPNLEHWAELWRKTEEVRQILNPTKEEKERRKFLEIKGKLNPKIRTAIDNIAEDFRKVIEEKEHNHYKSIVQKYIDKYGKTMTHGDRKSDKQMSRIIYNLYKSVGDKYDWDADHVLISDWKEWIMLEAKKVSEEVISSFQYKMYDKIGGMISDIKTDFEVEVIGRGMYNNDIFFKFVDGSKFSIRNQIVSKISNQGTFFYTYPTTFHEAYLPDGKRIENPNEYNVKKAFNDFHKN